MSGRSRARIGGPNRRPPQARSRVNRTVVNNSVGTCSECGKVQFRNRKDAKAFYRTLNPGASDLRAYKCGDYWHFGGLPKWIKAGEERGVVRAPTQVA